MLSICDVIISQVWLGRQDSNLRMMESESIALPLGDAPLSYSSFNMGWVVGFEPTHAWTTTMCLNHLTIPTICLSFLHITASLLTHLSVTYIQYAPSSFVHIPCSVQKILRIDCLFFHAQTTKMWRPGTGSNRRPPA